MPIVLSLLGQNFATKTISRVWLNHITYIPTHEGFIFHCAFVNMHSRKIIGWKTSPNIDSKLAIGALEQALTFRNPTAGLIVPSARGSQYGDCFRRRLTA